MLINLLVFLNMSVSGRRSTGHCGRGWTGGAAREYGSIIVHSCGLSFPAVAAAAAHQAPLITTVTDTTDKYQHQYLRTKLICD